MNTARTVCQECYKKHGKKWTKTGWKKARDSKTWKCPPVIKGAVFSPYPPPWCEHRAELNSMKLVCSCPKQTMIEG